MQTHTYQNQSQSRKPSQSIVADPDCPRCHGAGDLRKVYTAEELRAMPPYMIPSTHFVLCRCTKVRRERAAMERVWRGLSSTVASPTSVLIEQTRHSLWIRASIDAVRMHLARVLLDDPSIAETTRVYSDADLLNAENAWKRKKDARKATDAEDQRGEDGKLQAVDLYSPPGLLVLILGLACKEDESLPGLVSTACRQRLFRGKVTWVVDDPDLPLCDEHLAWSRPLSSTMARWTKVVLGSESDKGVVVTDWSGEKLDAEDGKRAAELAEQETKRAARRAAKRVFIDEGVREDCAEIGITDLTPQGTKNGGGSFACRLPGCKGTCSAWPGDDDGRTIIRCDNPKCDLAKTKPHSWLAAKLDKLKGEAGDEDDELIVTSEASPVELGEKLTEAVVWLRGQLVKGPLAVATVEANLKDTKISPATYRRARQELRVVSKNRTLSLPSVPTAPAAIPTGTSSTSLLSGSLYTRPAASEEIAEFIAALPGPTGT